MYGSYRRPERYDLLRVIMVRLGADSGTEKRKLIQLLHTVLLSEMTAQEKEKALQEEFGITPTEFLKEDIACMCNLSEGIEARGIKKGIEKVVQNMLDRGMSKEEIMKCTGLTEEQVPALKK